MLTRNQEIAATILSQLGARRFLMMTGARNMVAVENGLRFRLPKARNRNGFAVNIVEIILEPSDTYRVRTSYLRGTNIRVVDEATDIYCDVLQDVFTRMTGLHTKL